jgi:DNA polymerase III subunit epsilon
VKGRLLLIDTETGGLDPNVHSILSVAALVLNYDGQVIDEYYSLVNEAEEGFITATEEALTINGLTRKKCWDEGLTPAAIVRELLAVLKSHDMEEGITLVGHNVGFDRGFLKRLFDKAHAADVFGDVFSHRMICTQSGAGLLDQAGVIRLTSTSLDGVCKFFGITLDRSNGHHAMTDAKATAEVFRRLMLAARDGIHARA